MDDHKHKNSEWEDIREDKTVVIIMDDHKHKNSEWEDIREDNIARNQFFLNNLGFSTTSITIPIGGESGTRRKRKRFVVPVESADEDQQKADIWKTGYERYKCCPDCSYSSYDKNANSKVHAAKSISAHRGNCFVFREQSNSKNYDKPMLLRSSQAQNKNHTTNSSSDVVIEDTDSSDDDEEEQDDNNEYDRDYSNEYPDDNNEYPDDDHQAVHDNNIPSMDIYNYQMSLQELCNRKSILNVRRRDHRNEGEMFKAIDYIEFAHIGMQCGLSRTQGDMLLSIVQNMCTRHGFDINIPAYRYLQASNCTCVYNMYFF